MRRVLCTAIVANLLVGSPAIGADDPGLQLHGGHRSMGLRNLGMEATVLVRLGDRRNVSDWQKVSLNLRSGPVVRLGDGRLITGQLFGVETAPLYESRLQVAGQTVIAYQTRRGSAALARAGTAEGGHRNNISGLAVGAAVVVVALGVTFIAINNSFNDRCFLNVTDKTCRNN